MPITRDVAEKMEQEKESVLAGIVVEIRDFLSVNPEEMYSLAELYAVVEKSEYYRNSAAAYVKEWASRCSQSVIYLQGDLVGEAITRLFFDKIVCRRIVGGFAYYGINQ